MQQRTAAREPFHTGLLTRFESMLILSSAAIMLSIAMGLRQSLGLFQTPVVQDLGLQAADYAMAIAVQNIIWGVTQPFAGAFVDRFGPRLRRRVRRHHSMRPASPSRRPRPARR